MNSILLASAKRSTLAISKATRITPSFKVPNRIGHLNALFQQTAFYAKDAKRGREFVKFPWIWPSDSDKTPKKQFFQFTQNQKLFSFIWKIMSKFNFMLAQLGAFRSYSYLNNVRDEMIPLVLKRIAEAINKKDYEQLDELMTPYLSRLYKHAIANLSAQGYRIHLEVDVQESGVKKEYAQFKAGDPEAFDNTIPYKTRREGYSILNSEYMSIAFKRDHTTKEVKKLKFNTSLFHDWCAFEYGFVASANVKVNLRKGSRVVDSESGVMQIPISISTPHYFGTLGMINAVSGNEEAMAEEPFRWRVCDLFYIADWNNANSAAKESKYNP